MEINNELRKLYRAYDQAEAMGDYEDMQRITVDIQCEQDRQLPTTCTHKVLYMHNDRDQGY